MKVKLSLMLLVLALLASPAYAQTGLAGKWVGELSAADGHGVPQPITVDLKVDGETLSGTVTEGALESRPIMAASMEGTTVTFRTTRNFGASDINVNWKGALKGEDLTLTREIGPAPAEAGGGRGGGGGGGRGGAPAAGGRGGRGGGAAPAAAPAPAVPPVPAAQADGADGNAGAPAAAGGRGGARGGGRGGGGAPPAAGGPAAGGRGAAAPSVTLTLKRSR